MLLTADRLDTGADWHVLVQQIQSDTQVRHKCQKIAMQCKKERKKTDTPNEGWDEDRVPTCTSRILEERSGGQVGLSCS